MPFYETGNVRIAYEEAGKGFPLLIICCRRAKETHVARFKIVTTPGPGTGAAALKPLQGETRMIRFAAAVALLAVPALVHPQAPDGALKKIRDTKTLTIAYRTDAAPNN